MQDKGPVVAELCPGKPALRGAVGAPALILNRKGRAGSPLPAANAQRRRARSDAPYLPQVHGEVARSSKIILDSHR
jgi:hypothetical protein